MSNSFGVNGIPFPLDPTEHNWVSRRTLGVNGLGHTMYSAVREYQFKFVLTDTVTFWQLRQWFKSFSTGTVVVDLPRYAGSGYVFYKYSGCIINEPEQNTYFNSHLREVSLIISNIRTEDI